MSPSILLQLLKSDSFGLPNDMLSFENVLEMQSLQLIVFMLSICNLVLYIQDWNSGNSGLPFNVLSFVFFLLF